MSRALEGRLAALERAISDGPLLTLDVIDRPTPEQQTTIDDCTRSGRPLIVFYEPGNTAWLPGSGVPPWETAA